MKSKRLIAALCTAAMLLSFTACDSSTNDTINLSSNTTTLDFQEPLMPESSSGKTEVSTTLSNDSADAIEILNDIVEKDIENSISTLNADYEQLKMDIDTYAKYLESIDKMEAFYTKVYDVNNSLCLKMYEYSLEYAELIVTSEKSNDDKYDDLEALYDTIYDDAGDEIYDEIYDGILSEMYDDFYDGTLNDAYDTAPYSEWSDARSDEYDWWSDTRSDVYDDWSDFRSDVYGFWSDIRSEVWSDDMEKAQKKIDDFREDIEKLKSKSSQLETVNPSVEVTPTTSFDETTATETVPTTNNLVDGMRPEIKEALDSYEAFFDEYCNFMKKMKESPNDLSLLGDYTVYMTQYTETMEKIDALNNGSLNDAELKYYLEVVNRINVKLLEAAL